MMRKKAVDGIKIGDRFVVSRTFSKDDISVFAALTKDYNPVHFDKRFARIKKFEAKICHGLLVGSLVTEIGGQVGWLATEMHFKFLKPVYAGDAIRCELIIKEIGPKGFAVAEASMKKQDGSIVSEAVLKGILPGESEKKVMHDMMEKGDPTNKR